MKNLITGLIVAVLAVSAVAQAGTGSCTAGSFKVTFSGASFVTGIGWSSGGSRTINFSGSCSGCNLGPIIYGWGKNPLVEYYIGRGGGSSAGSYSTSKGSYTLQINQCNGPNITGSGSFQQYNCSGSNSSGQNMSEHYNGWRNLGKGTSEGGGYCIVMVESWSGGSGSATVSVPNSSFYSHWVGSGSANFTCGGGGSTTTTGGSSTSTTTTSGGSTTTSGWWWSTTTTSGSSTSTTTTSGGSTTTSGGSSSQKTLALRARGVKGDEQVNLRIDSTTIATWTLGTSMATRTATTYNSGGINVQYFNDADGRDVQVDYLVVNGSTRQAESQNSNTAVWQNGSCGGSYSEWMHCNGILGFGNTP
ncbi:MAG: glycoside hydrolase family 11 protein [Sedimentisphaerales bacterium]|nr:glycoside hydrolase family 11 protein [Sedimentisphaerales bacterium]